MKPKIEVCIIGFDFLLTNLRFYLLNQLYRKFYSMGVHTYFLFLSLFIYLYLAQ